MAAPVDCSVASYQMNSELESKMRKTTEKVSENMHIVANEPSLAFYRLQEHVRKSMTPMIEKRMEVIKLHQDLQGKCYDIEYSVSAVKAMQQSTATFANINELVKNVIFMRQQLKYEETRKQKKEPSMYKRLSAHISLDFPDLPELSDALRETASRVESVFTQARQSTHPELQKQHSVQK